MPKRHEFVLVSTFVSNKQKVFITNPRPSKDPEMDLPGSGDVPDVLLNEQLQLPHMDMKNH